MSKTIEVPVTLIKKLSKATRAFQELEDELEDFLLFSDPEFLAKMRRSRANHLAGKTRPVDDLKKELMYRIETTPDFDKDFKSLDREVALRILKKLDWLSQQKFLDSL